MNMKNELSWITAALALTGFASGCESDKIDIGDDEPGVLGASLSDYEGTWVGYAENAEWNDETDAVRVVLDESGDGVIEFGEADALPPPAADEGYPPGESDDPTHLGPMPVGVVSGFSYPVAGAIVQSNRIRMRSSSQELYREWCSLMTPHPFEPGSDAYSCLPNVGFGSTEDGCYLGNEPNPIDCGLLACMHVCTCDESGCSVEGDGHDVRLDAALESNGNELEGSLDTPQGRFQVRMTRE